MAPGGYVNLLGIIVGVRRLAFLPLIVAACQTALPGDLPSDCRLAVHIDFAKLRKTAAYQSVRPDLDELFVGYEGVMEGAGFRPDTDLDSLTLGLGGKDVVNDPHFYAVVRGRIDRAKLETCMSEADFDAASRDGLTVFTYGEPDPSLPRFALTDEGVFLLARPGAGLERLGAAVRRAGPPVDLLDAHACAVFASTPAIRKELRADPRCAPLAELKHLTLTYTAKEKIEVVLAADALSEAGAKRVIEFLGERAGAIGADRVELTHDGAAIRGACALEAAEVLLLMGVPTEATSQPALSGRLEGVGRPLVVRGAPELTGDGELLWLAVRGQVNSVHASPDDQYVFVDRALHSDLVLDARLRVVRKMDYIPGRLGFARDGRTALWVRGSYARVRDFPNLEVLHEAKCTRAILGDPWAVARLPEDKGWAIVVWGTVLLFEKEPPRWGASGTPSIGRAIAGAVDPETGHLVMIGDKTRFEVFDLATMTSLGTLDLPCTKVTYDVVAAGGRAWVGTKDGVILPVDIRAQRLVEPVRVADGGDIKLALSGPGGVLAVLAEKFVDAHHHPTIAKIYRIEGGGLREIASASFVGPCEPFDICVLEHRSTVLIGGPNPLVWRYRAKP